MFDTLLLTIMAALAQGLKRASPEPGDLAIVRLDMIADQVRAIAFDPSALRALAGVQIAPEDLQSQTLPACGLV
jgi:hypothetical protein